LPFADPLCFLDGRVETAERLVQLPLCGLPKPVPFRRDLAGQSRPLCFELCPLVFGVFLEPAQCGPLVRKVLLFSVKLTLELFELLEQAVKLQVLSAEEIVRSGED
jgi:hypothetical protein